MAREVKLSQASLPYRKLKSHLARLLASPVGSSASSLGFIRRLRGALRRRVSFFYEKTSSQRRLSRTKTDGVGMREGKAGQGGLDSGTKPVASCFQALLVKVESAFLSSPRWHTRAPSSGRKEHSVDNYSLPLAPSILGPGATTAFWMKLDLGGRKPGEFRKARSAFSRIASLNYWPEIRGGSS